MALALAIIQVLNAAMPGITQFIVNVNKDGTVTVGVTLDHADAQFDANIAQAQSWLAAHKT